VKEEFCLWREGYCHTVSFKSMFILNKYTSDLSFMQPECKIIVSGKTSYDKLAYKAVKWEITAC